MRFWHILWLPLVVLACESDPICEPGEQRACSCSDGRQGSMACVLDGGGFGPCICGMSSTGGTGGTWGTGGTGGTWATGGTGGFSVTGGTAGSTCSEYAPGADLSGVDWGMAPPGFPAFMQSTADLAGATAALTQQITDACTAIAVDLGADPGAVTETDPITRLSAWCDLAEVGILAAIGTWGAPEFVAQPPWCSFAAETLSACEYGCADVPGCGTPLNDLFALCGSMDLAGLCPGDCTGTCEATVSPISCDGACMGRCTGACQGTCTGLCDGSPSGGPCPGVCEGTCAGRLSGQCQGSCVIDTSAVILCDGVCVGGCSLERLDPTCHRELWSSGCDCFAACAASAAAAAPCQRGVVVANSGSLPANVLQTIEQNLPLILLVAQVRGGLLVRHTQEMLILGGRVDPSTLGPKAATCFMPALVALSSAAEHAQASYDASLRVASAAQAL